MMSDESAISVTQTYAIKVLGGWAVLIAPIPCDAGQGECIADGLTEEEVVEFLASPHPTSKRGR